MSTTTAPAAPLRVALMEDHAIVRAGIGAPLERIEGVSVVAQVSNAVGLLQVLAETPVDVVLCDLNVPGMDAIACIEHLRRHQPHVKAVVLSMEDSATAARLACARGAVGYVVEHAAATELGSALQCAREGRPYFSPRIARMLLQKRSDAPDAALTPRQMEMVRRVAECLSSREMGIELGLSARTVRGHLPFHGSGSARRARCARGRRGRGRGSAGIGKSTGGSCWNLQARPQGRVPTVGMVFDGDSAMWMNVPPEPATDLGPLPEVRESSTETSWQLFQELQDTPALGRPRGDLPFPVLAESAAAAPPVGLTPEQVMLVVSRRNRVCPSRLAWERFHDVLQAATRQAAPPPLTQQELATTSSLGKRVRVRHQVEWAARHGVLHIAHAFLAGLGEEEWLHAG